MRRRGAVAAAAVLLACGACADGLQFRADDRLRFVAPPDRSLADGPVAVRWAFSGDGARRPRFAVFVDAVPMRPGEGVADLADDDPRCRPSAGCPDRRWLANRGVHLTRQPRVRLPPLPRDGGEDLGDVRRHEVVVVLLDDRHVRLGEVAWTLTLFTAEEPG